MKQIGSMPLPTEVDRKTMDRLLHRKSPSCKWLLDHDRLNDLLNDGRSKTLVVRPIVVFPEWFVEPTNLQRKPDVWVVNVKLLPNCLSNEPSVLPSELIDAVANTLTRHGRQLAA